MARAHKIAATIAFVLLTAWLLVCSWQASPYSSRPAQNEGSHRADEPWLTKDAAGFFTFLLVVVGGLQIVLFYVQLRFMRETLNDAKVTANAARDAAITQTRQFLATHRPLIRFRHVWLSGPIQRGSQITGSVTCVNSGTGIAKIGEVGTRFHVLKQGEALPMPSQYAPQGASGDVNPGQAFPLRDTTYTLSEKDEIAIMGGDAKLFFVGYVIYWDTADLPRTSSFCRVMPQPGSPEDNGLLAVYNDPNYEFQD
jgi:hypothetical protein